MFKYRRFLQGAIAFLTAVFVIACNGPRSNNDSSLTEVPLGVAVAQTSNIALFGQEQVLGAQIAEAYFNENGGINGKPLKVILQDVAADEQGAINAFNTLINQNKVVGIVGPTLSQQAFAADPIADRAQVPVLGPSNTAEGIPQIGQFIGRVSAPVSVVAPNAVAHALKMNPELKRVAVFFAQNDAFSKSETETFQGAVRDFGLELVTVQKFQTTDTDFQAQATAAINAKPDLVIISGLAADAGNLVKQLRELGYNGLIVGGNGLNTSNIFPVCQAKCDGVLVAQAYSAELDNEINRAFRDAYFQKNQKEPPQFSAQAFTAIQVFVEALRKLDSKTPLANLALPELRQQLRAEIFAGTYTTPLGEISFTEEGDIIQKEFFVAQIEMDESGQQGRFAFVETN
ncbi:MAG: ABC transporter substrate-binding protein [Synechococcus sp.]|nr:ABC transporter substrate-binding protein [Synechococcus sp.]